MPAIDIVERMKAIQYTGSNSAEIDSLITDFTVTSEGGGTLHFDSGGSSYVVDTGDWVRFAQGSVSNTHTTSGLDFIFIRNAVYDDISDLAGDIAALQADVAALEATGSGLMAAGAKECPLLIVGNTTVAVDIIPAMPNTSYTPYAEIFASVALLGALSVTSVTVVDTDTVNVVINNSGLIGLNGAAVLVTVTA